MMLPIFTAIAADMQSRIRVAFALLIPTVILLSAFGSLVGAGAHIAAVELLTRMTNQSVSFAYWTLLCLPVAVLTSFIAAELTFGFFSRTSNAGRGSRPLRRKRRGRRYWDNLLSGSWASC
jgi:hypothetical protein